MCLVHDKIVTSVLACRISHLLVNVILWFGNKINIVPSPFKNAVCSKCTIYVTETCAQDFSDPWNCCFYKNILYHLYTLTINCFTSTIWLIIATKFESSAVQLLTEPRKDFRISDYFEPNPLYHKIKKNSGKLYTNNSYVMPDFLKLKKKFNVTKTFWLKVTGWYFQTPTEYNVISLTNKSTHNLPITESTN